MPTLLEMAKDIVAAHASQTRLTSQELLSEIHEVYAALLALEKGQELPIPAPSVPAAETAEQGPVVSKRKAFGKTQIICMVCGKGGMKTLTRHLRTAHDMKPGQYRKQFNIAAGTSLAAQDYSEARRQMAIERGLGEKMAEARAARGKGKAAAETQAETPKQRTIRRPAAKKPAEESQATEQ